MESEGFAERLHVVISAVAGVVGGMYAYAEIGAHHKHADIQAQTGSGAEGYVAQERLAAQFATGAQLVFLKKPYVAGIEEYCTMNGTYDWETVFWSK